MDNMDALYQAFQSVSEERKRRNFSAFMNKLESNLVEDLNKAYASDPERYKTLLNNIKARGIRVFRNDNGEHKLKFI